MFEDEEISLSPFSKSDSQLHSVASSAYLLEESSSSDRSSSNKRISRGQTMQIQVDTNSRAKNAIDAIDKGKPLSLDSLDAKNRESIVMVDDSIAVLIGARV